MSKPSLVIMAGGTGGHVFPGLAVAKQMATQGWKIEWIGTADKMEAELVPKHGYNIHFIDIGGVRGKSLFTKMLAPLKLLSALFQSIRLLRRIQPKVVLGMGGYASGPGGIAAWVLNIPLIIHEQNAIFGMTNKYLAKIAKYILTGFDLFASPSNNHKHNVKPSNMHYVGNPIRESFFAIAEKANQDISSPVNILIIGGSLGALALNRAVPKALLSLVEDTEIRVKHQSGRHKHEQVKSDYNNMPNVDVLEFIDDMESAFAWSDIIICRAGALTVAEVAGAGRAALFVPLPIAVDDHQTVNAKYLSDKGGAIILPQAALEDSLLTQIRELCESPKLRSNMAAKAKACAHPRATAEICAVIEQASKERKV